MKTPTTIEALEGAIEILEAIHQRDGLCAEFHERLQVLKEARDAHHEQQMKLGRQREQLRELSGQRRKGLRL